MTIDFKHKQKGRHRKDQMTFFLYITYLVCICKLVELVSLFVLSKKSEK